ncbi:hypothetical protein ILUMI_07667 [Ignelater luminosus]|uniref:C2H2-type domain-containing protein n=1 Tax=Ignelater luminosus TaxID=2038154 RepID=A0A8K0D335_IGNLU|nr:hypothetical protein ILUMI_07667 [Ignelater luminosus]
MHIRSHIEPYWCNLCLDMFSSAAKLQDHVKNCHETEKKSKRLIKHNKNNGCANGEKPFKNSLTVKTELYKCGYCNYSSAYIKRLRYHMRVHEKERLYYCDRCNFTTLAEWIMECHMDAHETEQHECSECGYISMYKEELSLHMQIHKKEKKFKCDQCSFSTSHLGYFNAHSSFHKLKEPEADIDNRKSRKLYRCEKCDYFTKQQRMLYRHDKKMHGDNKAIIRSLVLSDSEAKLHMCMKCGFWAPTQDAFMEHLTTHEDEKPYKCHLCDFITNNECDLDIHSKNHCGQECFRCAICNCKFLTLKELEDHSKGCSHNTHSTKIKSFSVGENT